MSPVLMILQLQTESCFLIKDHMPIQNFSLGISSSKEEVLYRGRKKLVYTNSKPNTSEVCTALMDQLVPVWVQDDLNKPLVLHLSF